MFVAEDFMKEFDRAPRVAYRAVVVACAMRIAVIFRDEMPAEIRPRVVTLLQLCRRLCVQSEASVVKEIRGLAEDLDHIIETNWDVTGESLYNSLITLAIVAHEIAGDFSEGSRAAGTALLDPIMPYPDTSDHIHGEAPRLVEVDLGVRTPEGERILKSFSAMLSWAIEREARDPLEIYRGEFGIDWP